MPRPRAAVIVVLFVLAALVTACSSGGSAKSSSPSSSAAPAAAPSSTATTTTAMLPVAHPTVWLCKPGMANNPCEGGLDATAATPGQGSGPVQPFTPAADPKIDCFYIYPTLSEAPGRNAPLAPEPAAIGVARAQAARFGSVCRLFVPVYRQLTLASIANGGFADPAAQKLASDDVDSAWHDYLNTENKGRGVVLIGHSQGAGQLTRLIRSEVDNNPAERSKLVSAILLGGNVLVPQGKDVGGAFNTVAACRRTDQTGCVVAFSSFATTPPSDSLFGRTSNARNLNPGANLDGMQVLCVNPTTLGAGPADLHPYLPTRNLGGRLTASPRSALPDLPTGFVTFSGLRGECRNEGGASWLQITGNGSPYAVGATTEAIGPTWGLHLLDVSDTYGDLVDLVEKQSAAWHG